MAEKRMFAKSIIDSDDFLDMPISTRLLYYDLGMRADDDGFINSPKKLIKMIGASEDDLKILILRKFIIPFENGVVVIRHWRIHNYIRKDTYHETVYQEQKATLEYAENKAYELKNIERPRAVDGTLTQNRLDKSSIDKNSVVVENEQSDSCVDEIVDFYNNNIGPITPFVFECLKDYEDSFGAEGKEIVLFALQNCVDSDVKNMKYIKATLNAWCNKGVKTLLEAKKENEEHNKQKKGENNGNIKQSNGDEFAEFV